MNKIYLRLSLFIIIFTFVFESIPVFAWNPQEGLSAESAILIETGRGQVLYQKNADSLISPSVICKLMTALIVIEKSDLNSKVTISKNSAHTDGASLNLTIGNLYTVQDLLHGVMLSDGNDAAIALAEYVGNGDVHQFVNLMNDKAKELMLTNTFFVNPTGIYDKNQHTSASDTAKFIKAAISNPVFNDIFGSRGIAWLYGKDSSILTSKNKLFWSYSGIDGGKLVSSPEQGTSSVTTASRNERRLVAFVSDKNDKAALNQTVKLLDYGFSDFSSGTLLLKDTTLRTISVQGVDVSLVSKMDVYYTYPIGDSYIKNIKFIQNEKLQLPLNTDTIAGVLSYVLNDGTVIDVNLYSNKNIVTQTDYDSKILTIINENHDLVVIIVFLLAIELILILYKITKYLRKAG